MKLEEGMSYEEKHKWLEENLEENMYVRTDDGIDRFQFKYKIEGRTFYTYHFEKESITNPEYYIIGEPSFNITDLIEAGDIIEVEEFKGKYEVRQFGFELSIVKDEYIYNLNSLHCKLNIKSIVTKEQFESMEYRIGE